MFIHSIIYARTRSRVYITAHLMYVRAYNCRSVCSRKSGGYQFAKKADGEFCGDPLAIFTGLEGLEKSGSRSDLCESAILAFGKRATSPYRFQK